MEAARPVDENHALVTGLILGAFMKAGLTARPVSDEGVYLDTIEVNMPEFNFQGEPLKVYVTVHPVS